VQPRTRVALPAPQRQSTSSDRAVQLIQHRLHHVALPRNVTRRHQHHPHAIHDTPHPNPPQRRIWGSLTSRNVTARTTASAVSGPSRGKVPETQGAAAQAGEGRPRRMLRKRVANGVSALPLPRLSRLRRVWINFRRGQRRSPKIVASRRAMHTDQAQPASASVRLLASNSRPTSTRIWSIAAAAGET
jgi:hypothetical protein